MQLWASETCSGAFIKATLKKCCNNYSLWVITVTLIEPCSHKCRVILYETYHLVNKLIWLHVLLDVSLWILCATQGQHSCPTLDSRRFSSAVFMLMSRMVSRSAHKGSQLAWVCHCESIQISVIGESILVTQYSTRKTVLSASGSVIGESILVTQFSTRKYPFSKWSASWSMIGESILVTQYSTRKNPFSKWSASWSMIGESILVSQYSARKNPFSKWSASWSMIGESILVTQYSARKACPFSNWSASGSMIGESILATQYSARKTSSFIKRSASGQYSLYVCVNQ